jgi:hypothetical protein
MGGIYDAALTKKLPPAYPTINCKTLSVAGACFDTVAAICASFEEFRDSSALIIQPFLDICLSLDVIYAPTGQIREEVLGRTWIADFHGTCPAP